MDLTHLYSLRNDFTIIGLTGRTGSGCTMISEILSKDFNNLKAKGLRGTDKFSDPIFKQKYDIVKNFLSYEKNWSPFEIIRYKNVLLFYIFNFYGDNSKSLGLLLDKYYKESSEDENIDVVRALKDELKVVFEKNKGVINDIGKLKRFHKNYTAGDLNSLNDLFFGKKFKILAKKVFSILEIHGYFKRTYLLHHISCNIRRCGDPLDDTKINIDSIYSIAILINKLIKARKKYNKKNPTKIVIDSLRNSLEIMFFKERYSAFYMIATKDVLSNARSRIDFRLRKKILDEKERGVLVNRLLKLDETEYRTKDFSKGEFSSPDVENCIQKSDYHIFNLKKGDVNEFIKTTGIGVDGFITREEQLMKFISLVIQPGLITPSSLERCMQVANTAKVNSGCISRKVGAAITDVNYYVMAVGWNDVAKGHTPCNLRNVDDFLSVPDNLNNVHYSDFERGNVSSLSDYKYKGDSPGNFKEAIKDYYENHLTEKRDDLKGKNCSFCFKTIHNHYEGEINQVHTRSLHAEENAMLQITKNGGEGCYEGSLFTTASPCELCSKKAYQLGIKRIYFIDPYPGISNDQILLGGELKTRPVMIPFSGAIGVVYHKLYEPFLSYKDEISMSLELKPKNKLGIQFKNILKGVNNPEVKKYLKGKVFTDEDVLGLISKELSKS